MSISVPVPRRTGTALLLRTAGRLLIVWCLLTGASSTLHAADDAQLLATMAALDGGQPADRRQAILSLGHSHDLRLIPFLDDFAHDNAYLWKGRVVLAPATSSDGHAPVALLDPLSRAPLLADGHPLSVAMSALHPLSPSRRERMLARDAIVFLSLADPDESVRLAALTKIAQDPVAGALTELDAMAKSGQSKRMQRAIAESSALIRLDANAPGPAATLAERISSAQILGDLRSARALSRLHTLADAAHTDPALARTAREACNRIERWQTIAEVVGDLFSGLSLGSVLVLMALGLSIVFGLMGVINMAHGEMMMIGAYATYLTQKFFILALPPAWHDWYFPVAIPMAFLASGAVGLLIEWAIIRHLYGRPLETLLATWGVSLALIQLVRVIFGDNIAVNSPSYLQGGFEIATDITLPYARLFILVFTALCIVALTLLIDRTRLGLLLRATTQNRTMAATLGVATRRIDGMTFALGSGLAGIAGCSLTLIGGVTPDMGQNYIVDSFMVVVTGGVGKLVGAVWAGMGLGVLNKVFEPLVQAVWAKVFILAIVILFIQRKPSGLFPAKGRLADV